MTEERNYGRYMVESPHDAEDCAMMVNEVRHMGYLHHFEWGCKSGVHIGWAVLEAESAEQALMVVPPLLRKRARAVGLTKWLDEDFEE
jgi:hypothetical protein